MKKFSLIFGLVLFLFLLNSSLGFAQMGCMQMKGADKPHGMMGVGRACGIMQHADKLDLTAQQKDKIKKIHFEAKKQAIKLKAEIELAQLEVKHMMMADTPKENEILKAVDKLGQLKTKMKMAKIQKKFEVRQVLTKEQLAKWKEMKKKCCGTGDKMECGKMGKHMMMKGGMIGEPEMIIKEVKKNIIEE